MDSQKEVIIKNKFGLHVRPATTFAELARKFGSTIQVIKDGQTVDGKSCIDLLTLAAEAGSKLVIRAEGEDAQAAVDALSKLIESGFGEE